MGSTESHIRGSSGSKLQYNTKAYNGRKTNRTRKTKASKAAAIDLSDSDLSDCSIFFGNSKKRNIVSSRSKRINDILKPKPRIRDSKNKNISSELKPQKHVKDSRNQNIAFGLQEFDIRNLTINSQLKPSQYACHPRDERGNDSELKTQKLSPGFRGQSIKPQLQPAERLRDFFSCRCGKNNVVKLPSTSRKYVSQSAKTKPSHKFGGKELTTTYLRHRDHNCGCPKKMSVSTLTDPKLNLENKLDRSVNTISDDNPINEDNTKNDIQPRFTDNKITDDNDASPTRKEYLLDKRGQYCSCSTKSEKNMNTHFLQEDIKGPKITDEKNAIQDRKEYLSNGTARYSCICSTKSEKNVDIHFLQGGIKAPCQTEVLDSCVIHSIPTGRSRSVVKHSLGTNQKIYSRTNNCCCSSTYDSCNSEKAMCCSCCRDRLPIKNSKRREYSNRKYYKNNTRIYFHTPTTFQSRTRNKRCVEYINNYLK